MDAAVWRYRDKRNIREKNGPDRRKNWLLFRIILKYWLIYGKMGKFVRCIIFTPLAARGYHHQQKFDYDIPFPVRLISQTGEWGTQRGDDDEQSVRRGPSNLGVNIAMIMDAALSE